MSLTLLDNYKEELKPFPLTTLFNATYDDEQVENWIESFRINVLSKVENDQIPFIQQLNLFLDDSKSIFNVSNIARLIAICPPPFYQILLIYLQSIIYSEEFDIQNILDFDLIFGPLIEIARNSFFEFPQNTNLLICFVRSFISNNFFYTFFLQTPCIEIPFDFISLLYSDAVHDISEQEREQFDTSLMSNCISLIGDFFNYDLILNLPHFENSISQLLYNIKCPKYLISYSSINGTIKALKISPQSTIKLIFEGNMFSDLISILSKDEELNSENVLFDQSMEIENIETPTDQISDQEKVKINILNLIYLIINYDENKQYYFQIIESISDQLHVLLQKSEIFQIKAMKILLSLSQSLNSDEQNLLFKLEATNDSIQFLMMNSSFNLKILSFQFFSSLMKFPDFQFFKDHLIIFEYISQSLWSLSFSDLCIFIQSLKTLLSLFNQRNDDSLSTYLIQTGFVEELSSLANNTDDNDKNEISEIVNFVNSFQTNDF